MRRLVIAPHMDDESLGCGGLIAKYPDQTEVVVLTDSGPVRQAEHAAALRELGARPSRVLGLPDGELAGRARELVTALDEVLSEVRPDEVYLPYPSLHQDHIAAYEAGMRACRLSMSEAHWFPPGVFVYDIAAYDVNLYQNEFRWNVFEALTEQQVDRKAAACAAYASEIPSGAHPMRSIKQMAEAIGTVRKVAYAEQFALVRAVRP